MKNSEYLIILQVLKKANLENLKCDKLRELPYQDALDILKLDFWRHPKYRSLLTEKIWNFTAQEITDILTLPGLPNSKFEIIWEDPRFKPLLTKGIWRSKYEDIKNIVYLDFWKKPFYRKVLGPNIWNSSAESVKLILTIPGKPGTKYATIWENPHYTRLLTPSIWSCNYENVKDIIELECWENPMYYKVLTPSIWNNTAENVKQIAEMPGLPNTGYKILWEDPKYNYLLTPSIFQNIYQNVWDIINLPYWQDKKYSHLLTPTLWGVNISRIHDTFSICEKLGIEKYIKSNMFRLRPQEIEALYYYLKDNNIPVFQDTKLHPIFSISKYYMLKRYNIDLDFLVQRRCER